MIRLPLLPSAPTPPSTLTCFANAFDFTGFNEMKQLFRMNLVEETASYSDRARLFREMESEAVPETPLDILQEFARSNAQALQQLAARAEPEMLERAVQLLADADTIYIAGLRRSFSVAAYLTYALSIWSAVLSCSTAWAECCASKSAALRRATSWCR